MVPLKALIDAGPLIAYYDKTDQSHAAARRFFENFRGHLLVSEPVCTEVMWLLKSSWRVQNEFLSDLRKGLYQLVNLEIADLEQIAILNEKYQNVPADFADLSLVAISARLKINKVVSLDSDFDIYRACGGKAFKQLFPKWE